MAEPYKSQLTLFENRKGLTGIIGAGMVFTAQWVVGFCVVMFVMIIWWWDTEGKWKYALGLGAVWALFWSLISYYVIYHNTDRIGAVATDVMVPGSGQVYKLAAAASDSGLIQATRGTIDALETPSSQPRTPADADIQKPTGRPKEYFEALETMDRPRRPTPPRRRSPRRRYR